MTATAVGDLLREPTLDGRLATLRAEGLADEAGLSWMLDQVEELVHDEPLRAEQLGTLCAAAAETAGLPTVVARAQYGLARVAAERGELDTALGLIDAARSAWAAAGDRLSALRTDLGRMQILADLGRRTEAVDVGLGLLRALPAPTTDADAERADVLAATAHNNLGAAYGLLGEHEQELEAYGRAEAAYAALGQDEATAQPRANRGSTLLELGRAREALAALTGARRSFAAAGDRLWAAKCAGIEAQAYSQLGQLGEALRVLRPARETLEALGAEAEAARLQLDIATVYLAAGLFTEAHTEAAAVVERMRTARMVPDQAVATFTAALALAADDQPEAAATALQTAADLFDQVGDRQYRARTLLAQADLAAGTGRDGLARALFREAADQLRDGGWLVPLAWATLRQADLAEHATERDSALEAGGHLIDELGRPPALQSALLVLLARRDRERGETASATDRLRQAVSLGERVSATLPDWVLRTAHRATQLGPSDELVDLLLVDDDPAAVAEAARVSELAKARTLQDLVAGTVGSAAPAGEGPESRLALQRTDLSAAYAALLVAETPAQRVLVRQRVVELERELGRAHLSSDQAVAAGAPAGSGPAHEGLAVSFHVAGDDLDIFVIDDGRVEVRRQPGVMPAVTHELDRLAGQWHRFRMGSVFAQRNATALAATTRTVLHDLYRLLLEPVADLLPAAGPLTVVPHRQLHQVPLHALHDGRHALLERGPVTVTPTLAGAGPAPRVRALTDGVLVLAVPDAQAPAILEEGRAVAAAVPGSRLLVGEDATSEAVRRHLPGPAAVHIACHGLFRPANPLFSSLRLGDRWVTSAEVMELDLGGALVTLSACESGRPDQATAEPVGLAWAFLAAGASGAVVSQWVVHDQAAADLFSVFYTRLAAGQAPSMALRDAQLATAEHHPHPYYWAPFSYVASPRPSGGSR